ncbi:glycosyltransferase 87 family protein [Amycolatopsis sp. NPDC004747]
MGLAVAIVLLAFAVRWSLVRYDTADYRDFLRPWYEFIIQHGGFRALREDFTDYNVPYRYLLVLLTYLPFPPQGGIKALSVLFDLVAAYFTYRIVALKYRSRWTPAVAALLVFMLPTVVLNGAMWAQCDSIYASFTLGGVYHLLRRRPWWACAFIGLAVSFKLQAIFILPLLLAVVLLGRVPWRALLVIPAVYLALDLPAIVLGADPIRLLTIYPRQSGLYSEMTLNAPSVWQFFRGVRDTGVMHTAGLLVTVLLVLTVCLLLLLARAEPTGPRIVLIGTVFVILVPYVLPSMHERYFYLADLLTVVLAFYFPRRLWYVPIGVQFVSLLSSIPGIFESPGGERAVGPVDFRVLAAIELAMLIAVGYHAIREFRRSDEVPDEDGDPVRQREPADPRPG